MARQFRARKMSMNWSGIDTGEQSISSTQAVDATFTSGVAATIMRCRGSILVRGTPDALTDDSMAAFGLIVVSSDAAGVGGASVPGPASDLDAPWLWHAWVPLLAGAAALTPDGIGDFHRLEIDAKAMRRTKSSEVLAFVSQLGVNSYAAVAYVAGIRVLSAH